MTPSLDWRRVPTVVAAGVLAAGLGIVVSAPPDDARYWLAALWAAWGVTLMWALVLPVPSLAIAGLEVFLLLEVLVPATAAVLAGATYIGPYDVTAGTVGALRLAVIAQLSLLAGALVVRAWRGSPVTTRPAILVTRARLDRWATTLLAAAVVALVAYVVLARGDATRLFVLAGEAKYNEFQRTAEGPVVKYFSSLVGLAGTAIVVVALRFSTHGWRRPLMPVAVAGASVVLLSGGGGRWFLAVPAVAAVLVWWRTSDSPLAARPRLIIVGGALALFVFAVLVGGLRDQAGVKLVDTGSFLDKQVHGGVFATTAVLVETVPDHVGYLDGRSYAELVAMPVPRALWPDKPEGAVKDLQRAFFPKEIGAAYPFYGEAYANFGWWGVVVACVAFAALLEGLWLRLVAARSVAAVVVWAALIPVLLQLFSRGYLAGLVGAFFGFLLGIAAVATGLRGVARSLGPTETVPPGSKTVLAEAAP